MGCPIGFRGNMGTKTRGLPLLFNLEPWPNDRSTMGLQDPVTSG